MAIPIKKEILRYVPKNKITFFEDKIADIVEETFVVTADDDYLNARWLCINGLHRLFFWASAQAIEKYLKANLLFKGVSVKEFDHNIISMANILRLHDTLFAKYKFIKPSQIDELNIKNGWEDSSVGKFIEILNKYGSPDNRYDFFGVNYKFSYMFKLDQLVFFLRKNVTERDFPGECNNIENVLYYAYEHNYNFAPNDYEHQPIFDLPPSYRITVPSIERALKNCYGNAMAYKKWLIENIKIDTNKREFKRNR